MLVDPVEPQRVDLVQRPELAVGVPPAVRELAEFLQLLRIDVERLAHACGAMRCCQLAAVAVSSAASNVVRRRFVQECPAADPHVADMLARCRIHQVRQRVIARGELECGEVDRGEIRLLARRDGTDLGPPAPARGPHRSWPWRACAALDRWSGGRRHPSRAARRCRISSNKSSRLLLAAPSVPSPTFTPASSRAATGAMPLAELQVGARAVRDVAARLLQQRDFSRIQVHRVHRDQARAEQPQPMHALQRAHARSASRLLRISSRVSCRCTWIGICSSSA